MSTAHQATCVAIGGRGVLIEGVPGIGKSSLALLLIDRGAEFVGDDSLLLAADEGKLIASPHPHTRGLIEVRNLGLISMPVRDSIAVTLRLVLEPAAPRYVELAESTDLLGIAIPTIRLSPDGSALHLKAELALERFGLLAG